MNTPTAAERLTMISHSANLRNLADALTFIAAEILADSDYENAAEIEGIEWLAEWFGFEVTDTEVIV